MDRNLCRLSKHLPLMGTPIACLSVLKYVTIFLILFGHFAEAGSKSKRFAFEGEWIRTRIRCLAADGKVLMDLPSPQTSMKIIIRDGVYRQEMDPKKPECPATFSIGSYSLVGESQEEVVMKKQSDSPTPCSVTWRGQNGGTLHRFSIEDSALIESIPSEFAPSRCNGTGEVLQWIYELPPVS